MKVWVTTSEWGEYSDYPLDLVAVSQTPERAMQAGNDNAGCELEWHHRPAHIEYPGETYEQQVEENWSAIKSTGYRYDVTSYSVYAMEVLE